MPDLRESVAMAREVVKTRMREALVLAPNRTASACTSPRQLARESRRAPVCGSTSGATHSAATHIAVS